VLAGLSASLFSRMSALEKGRGNMTILAIDDAEEILDMYRDMFPGEIHTAISVAEGRKVLAKEEIQLILLDMDMPEESGMTLLKEMHHQKLDVPVIVVSAETSPATKVQAKVFGAIAFIEKPFDIVPLKTLARRLCKDAAWHATVRKD